MSDDLRRMHGLLIAALTAVEAAQVLLADVQSKLQVMTLRIAQDIHATPSRLS